jgi:hypothetical protein
MAIRLKYLIIGCEQFKRGQINLEQIIMDFLVILDILHDGFESFVELLKKRSNGLIFLIDVILMTVVCSLDLRDELFHEFNY